MARFDKPQFVGLQFAETIARCRDFFVTRDLILHDGSSLRRFSIAGRTQAVLAAAGAIMLSFTAYGAAQAAVTAASVTGLVDTPAQQVAALEARMTALAADVAAIRQVARAHAARVDQRQALIAAALTGDTDRARLNAAIPAIDPRAAKVAADVVAPLTALEARQAALAGRAQASANQRLAVASAHLRRLGLSPERITAVPVTGGAMGGPFEAAGSTEAAADIQADMQFRSLFMTWKKLDTIEQAVIAIPSAQPVDHLSFTSNYGIRSDPFRGVAAMHAGVDIPGPIGTPIYATADGFVGRAERSGGYGNLVEIEHGKGIQTRYGHLSKILVTPGMRIRRGQLIALMGSTGRSTGSHLHYEVRMDGHAVNPVPFLQTADYLLSIQDRALKPQPVAAIAAATGAAD